eukprot:960480-Pyramimonas_sp.AAC.1
MRQPAAVGTAPRARQFKRLVVQVHRIVQRGQHRRDALLRLRPAVYSRRSQSLIIGAEGPTPLQLVSYSQSEIPAGVFFMAYRGSFVLRKVDHKFTGPPVPIQ